MGKQSSRMYFNAYDHKDIYYDGHYHDKMFIGSDLVWEKLKESDPWGDGGGQWATNRNAAYNLILETDDTVFVWDTTNTDDSLLVSARGNNIFRKGRVANQDKISGWDHSIGIGPLEGHLKLDAFFTPMEFREGWYPTHYRVCKNLSISINGGTAETSFPHVGNYDDSKDTTPEYGYSYLFSNSNLFPLIYTDTRLQVFNTSWIQNDFIAGHSTRCGSLRHCPGSWISTYVRKSGSNLLNFSLFLVRYQNQIIDVQMPNAFLGQPQLFHVSWLAITRSYGVFDTIVALVSTKLYSELRFETDGNYYYMSGYEGAIDHEQGPWIATASPPDFTLHFHNTKISNYKNYANQKFFSHLSTLYRIGKDYDSDRVYVEQVGPISVITMTSFLNVWGSYNGTRFNGFTVGGSFGTIYRMKNCFIRLRSDNASDNVVMNTSAAYLDGYFRVQILIKNGGIPGNLIEERQYHFRVPKYQQNPAYSYRDEYKWKVAGNILPVEDSSYIYFRLWREESNTDRNLHCLMRIDLNQMANCEVHHV